MFESGDLVLLPFPFSDLSTSKRRPVLMLTAPDQLGDFMACPLTSRAGWFNARRLSPADLAGKPLPLDSWARPDKVVTLNTAQIVRRFGHVMDSFRFAIADDICRLLDAPAAGPASP